MQEHTNRLGHRHHVRYRRHLKLYHLKQEAQGLKNQHLFKEGIPQYPRPEFHVSRLRYDTKKESLRFIRRDEGFKAPADRAASGPGSGPGLVWFSLDVGPEEVRSAETRLLEKTFPDRTKEQADTQQSFLWRFATSPAFKETSRLGSYRFTFPLEEVLENYRDQFCSGQQPVMRVYKTTLFKQEVQYSVLVHSPANEEQFSKCPLLSDHPNAVCVYRDGRFVWRPEAMCETHRYKLVRRPDEKHLDAEELDWPESYVWDHVSVALHVDDQVLKFGAGRLRENLSFCYRGEAPISCPWDFDTLDVAEVLVKELWPNSGSELKEGTSLEQSFTAAGGRPV
ncbi:uncharacterized protein LOC125021505 isoform X2 [Mugil cephalus]|uniref:uncharacterized protein LOC125021505 isoform X2 n=1 Tax=Mugil cephalus TaxID=48193 RepID=UPI001FB77722|nr:uncharacterized protein LOC125021505 isoform X2 [Mugil cephalus]